MVGQNTRRVIPMVSAVLTIVGSVVAYQLTHALSKSQSWAIVGAWVVAGIIVTYLLSRVQARSQEQSPEAINERVTQLRPELRKQVQIRSYGARSKLIEAPLRELDLDITPRLGWVRDPRLIEPESPSKDLADDIVAAFESSKRRLLIVGEPGSGKTLAAYSLIEYLDEREGAEGRIPLLVNLSAWEAQDDFAAFLVDYLCSSVGYEVHERAVASALISSRGYSLILDGLDEIPVRLRQHFSERLDEFVRGLPGEVGVVVTCRIQEYEELLASHSSGIGLVQAVEILHLSDEQLDSAFVEVAKRDKEWETFLSQRHHTAYQRVRALLSNPLFLNLAVAGRLSPGQFLDWSTTEDELQGPVLESYLEQTLTDQRQYKQADARRYLSWIARYLNGAELSPFGLKTSDFTVFDLASLTPPEPPKRYRIYEALVYGLTFGLLYLVIGLFAYTETPWVLFGPLLSLAPFAALIYALGFALSSGVTHPFGLQRRFISNLVRIMLILLVMTLLVPFTGLPSLEFALGVIIGFVSRWTNKNSALSTRLTLIWPSTRQRRRDFLRKASRRAVLGSILGLVSGTIVSYGLVGGEFTAWTGVGIVFGLIYGLGFALFETRPGLIVYHTPTEAGSRSLSTALIYALVTALVLGLALGIALGLVALVLGMLAPTSELDMGSPLVLFLAGMGIGMAVGFIIGGMVVMNNGGWFVVLQKAAHRRLTRAGNLPPRPYDFLEWGSEKQIFRWVGGGVRFRHNLIQQHLAKDSEGTNQS